MQQVWENCVAGTCLQNGEDRKHKSYQLSLAPEEKKVNGV